MTLTPAFLDELRARTTLSALIGRSVKITRAGREYKACCPFHNEKTPSFTINDDKGFYHCFGCGAHGDAIRWMTEHNGLSFIDAVKELAQAAGLDMPEDDPRAAQRAERAKGLHEALADAAKFYTEQLHGIAGAEARALLERRGISAETARAFGMGYAPESRTKLREALKSYGDAMLVEAGLLIQVEGKEPYDRFRGRLMIPIKDARGRVIGFGGRIIGEGEPKYLNSPETPLFDKGRTLYNLDRASAASRKAGRVIAVEGYMDVIALEQAGFGETVAPLGTAMTEHQLDRLWRMADVPYLSFDGDNAGQKAAIRAAHRALPLLQPGRSLAFVTLPPGQDPDDLVRGSGPQAFEMLVDNAAPLSKVVYFSERSAARTDTPEGRAGLRANLHNLAASIQNPIVQKEYGRTFNDLFYEDFGWKRAERDGIKTGILTTSASANPQLLRLYTRSALYGLSRFPSVLASVYETIALLDIASDELLRWREVLVEAMIRRPTLDVDGVKAILATERVSRAERQNIQFDLRFQWDTVPSLAQQKLSALVTLLASEQEIDKRMVELNRRIAADPSLESYDVIELQRDKLRTGKRALYNRAFELGLEEGETYVG